MTRDELAAALADISRALDSRVEIWSAIVDETGQPTGERVYHGSFSPPPGWQPLTLEEQMDHAKGRKDQ